MIGSTFDSLLWQFRNFDKSVLSFSDISNFPAVWDTAFFYIDNTTWVVYRWDDTLEEYIALVSLSWMDLVSMRTEEPVIEDTQEWYTLYKYTYWSQNYYRKVPTTYDPTQDIFYSDVGMTNIVATRALSL